ncbi:inositol monophosphatase [Pendulispora rubella]|uniref:Inositol monophosphatase n=1 Tax=Pendulispora rubella TaxID=2741070 RepID=A0ABZ2KUQ3_9BACT
MVMDKNDDERWLAGAVEIVHGAGARLLSHFDVARRGALDVPGVSSAVHAIDEFVAEDLRRGLSRLVPEVGWFDDQEEGGDLPPGAFWVCDPVSGVVNYVQGLIEWCTSATLIVDNEAILTVVHAPLTKETYTAQRGRGAWLNGRTIRPSTRRDLRVAMVATSQAYAVQENPELAQRIGRSLTSVMRKTMLVRSGVPASMLVAYVADGRLDAFWLHGSNRADLLAGGLLAREAGAIVSDAEGSAPWTGASSSFVAAAPGLHAAFLGALGGANA